MLEKEEYPGGQIRKSCRLTAWGTLPVSATCWLREHFLSLCALWSFPRSLQNCCGPAIALCIPFLPLSNGSIYPGYPSSFCCYLLGVWDRPLLFVVCRSLDREEPQLRTSIRPSIDHDTLDFKPSAGTRWDLGGSWEEVRLLQLQGCEQLRPKSGLWQIWLQTGLGSERVTGRKARGLQMEEIGCKCQTF